MEIYKNLIYTDPDLRFKVEIIKSDLYSIFETKEIQLLNFYDIQDNNVH